MQKKVFLFIYVLLCFILLGFSYSKAEVIEGKVIKVYDGNTIEIRTSEKELFKIIFWGSDCPELKQHYGKEGLEFLEDVILRKKVKVEVKGKDREGNYLGIIFYNDENINKALVIEGYAWAELHYSKGIYTREQLDAQNSAIGLWQFKEPTPPWTFRREQTMKMAKGL